MPPKPFRDSARNINGDRTGKGKGVNEGILELWEGKGRRWGKHPPSSHSFFLMGAQQARPLTFGVPRGQGHEGAGCSKAGAVEVDRAKGGGDHEYSKPPLHCSASPCPPVPRGLARPPHLPTRRVGRGPKRSMRIPSGRVVALSTKEPMVKPRLSISS